MKAATSAWVGRRVGDKDLAAGGETWDAEIVELFNRHGTRSDRLPYALGVDADGHCLLEILVKAICQTAYPVTHLELGCRGTGICLLQDTFLRRGSAFVNLRSLKLTFERTKGRVPYSSEHKRIRGTIRNRLAHFRGMLREAQNLEILALALVPASQHSGVDCSQRIFKAVTREASTSRENRGLQKIRRLHLDHVYYRPKDLIAFVTATRSTLEVLKIDDPCRESRSLPVGLRWESRVREAFGEGDLELEGDIWDELNDSSADEGVDYCDDGDGENPDDSQDEFW